MSLDSANLSTTWRRSYGTWRRSAIAVACAATLIALGLSGTHAAAAVLAGFGLAGLGSAWCARALQGLLTRRQVPGAPATSVLGWACLSFLPRQAVIGAAVVALLAFGWPAGWLLVGLSIWPLAMVPVVLVPSSRPLVDAGC
ncbi:MAG: hypothetical protein AAF533_25465 [Acidobacteriota bacterium]